VKHYFKKRANALKNPEPYLGGSPWQESFKRLLKNKSAIAGLAIFVLICLSCVFAPFITRWDYESIDIHNVLSFTAPGHAWGTDKLGRDVLARILYGGRITLRISLTAAAMAAVVGTVIGLLAGYFGGWVDFWVSRFMDILASIPAFLLTIVVETAFGWATGKFVYALAIAATPQFARLMRVSVMNIMGREYIEASRALGVSHFGVVWRHVLHNAAAPMLVHLTTCIAETILNCTLMGYLGIGINPPTPEWGVLVAESKSFIRANPLITFLRCLPVTLSVISINFFGNGFRDALDPRESSL
jgi:peptide/nickel transport system permease protein